MNILRRMGAAGIAAITAASCLAAVANAESEEYKLLVSPMSISSASKDLALTDSGFISVTDEDIANWQKTGKFTYSELTTDFDIPESASIVKRISGNNVAVRWKEPDVTGSSLKVLSFDPDAKSLTTKTDFGNRWDFVTSDCTVINVNSDNEAKKLSITVTPVNGESTTNTFEYKGKGNWFYNCDSVYNNPKYVFTVLWVSDTKELTLDDNSSVSTYSYEIYGITREGEVETLYSISFEDQVISNLGWLEVGDNYISWSEEPFAKSSRKLIYLIDSKEVISCATPLMLYGSDLKCTYSNGEGISRIDYVTQAWDNAFIAQCPTDYSSDPRQYRYILFQNGQYSVNMISKAYKSMSSSDGKIFLMQTEDDKWGYIDANGKELATFDDASTFEGDYAPVIKDGKAYLIDRSMNRVSEMIDADGVTSINNNDQMFIISKGDKRYLATFALPAPEKPNTSDTSDTSSDTSVTSSDTSVTSSDTASSDTGDNSGTSTSTPVSSGSSETSGTGNDNPPTGMSFGLMLTLTAIAGTVALVSRKKR